MRAPAPVLVSACPPLATAVPALPSAARPAAPTLQLAAVPTTLVSSLAVLPFTDGIRALLAPPGRLWPERPSTLLPGALDRWWLRRPRCFQHSPRTLTAKPAPDLPRRCLITAFDEAAQQRHDHPHGPPPLQCVDGGGAGLAPAAPRMHPVRIQARRRRPHQRSTRGQHQHVRLASLHRLL